jgi:hypothetical protein
VGDAFLPKTKVLVQISPQVMTIYPRTNRTRA